VDTVNYRMRIDPKMHTVRAIPALRIARGDVDVDTTLPERRVVSIRLANTLTPILPVLAWRDEARWHVAGNTGHDGNYGILMQGYPDRSPIPEWRLYTLEAPPLC
jgi:hypothetical protein